MRKGEISLEMVIMLVVLLVLAGVIISLILHYLKPGAITPPEEALAKRDFFSKCEKYCKDMDSLDYCRYYYPGNDWNENGIKFEIIKVGKYEWPACEDRIYCFLIAPCEDRFGAGWETIETCRKSLCQIYLDKYKGDTTLANAALSDAIGFSIKCPKKNFDLKVPVEENWYTAVFKVGC